MNFYILTLFPEMVAGGLATSITGRAMEKGLISVEAINIRDYSKDKHRHVDDAPYGVVHRITARQGTKGVASYCLNWCFARCGNLRIDTHRKNLPMQRALARNGFVYCGEIYVRDGSERIAFQKNK